MNRRAFLKNAIRSGLLAGLSASVYGCLSGKIFSRSRKFEHPNILWIKMDDCRMDALGCYGSKWAKTPNMDRLADNGVLFKEAICQSPVCAPSRISFQTAQYPHISGVMNQKSNPPEINPYYLYSGKKFPNLIPEFKQLYQDPQNIGKLNIYSYNYDEGGKSIWKQLKSHRSVDYFDVYGKSKSKSTAKRLKEECVDYPQIIANEKWPWALGTKIPVKPEEMYPWKICDAAIETIEKSSKKQQPFFVRVSFHCPHLPWRVPPEYFIDPETIDMPIGTREELKSKPVFEQKNMQALSSGFHHTKDQIQSARSTYYGMVSLVDKQVGRLIDKLQKEGIFENTLIAITSDQGIQLMEHGCWEKGVLYEGSVRVPFIISLPCCLPKKVVEEPVEMVDFIPTLAEITDITLTENTSGKSLMPLIHGKVSKWKEACFCEIDHSMSTKPELREGNTGRRVMVRTKKWKMIFFMDKRVNNEDGALYNLADDPYEKINLYKEPRYKEKIEELKELAFRWDNSSKNIQ
jgi:arylsulfatase A-like enzyme